MLGIQRTIAVCYEYMQDEFPTIKKAVKYAQSVYLGKHRYTIRLYEHFYPALRTNNSKPTDPRQAGAESEYDK